jgi:hypothetical protein
MLFDQGVGKGINHRDEENISSTDPAFLRTSFSRILITFILMASLVGITIWVAEQVELKNTGILDAANPYFDATSCGQVYCSYQGQCNTYQDRFIGQNSAVLGAQYTYNCKCSRWSYGPDCSFSCPNSCSGQGDCVQGNHLSKRTIPALNSTQAVCQKCNPGRTGPDCSLKCSSDCGEAEGRGQCSASYTLGGISVQSIQPLCLCNPQWNGNANCSLATIDCSQPNNNLTTVNTITTAPSLAQCNPDLSTFNYNINPPANSHILLNISLTALQLNLTQLLPGLSTCNNQLQQNSLALAFAAADPLLFQQGKFSVSYRTISCSSNCRYGLSVYINNALLYGPDVASNSSTACSNNSLASSIVYSGSSAGVLSFAAASGLSQPYIDTVVRLPTAVLPYFAPSSHPNNGFLTASHDNYYGIVAAGCVFAAYLTIFVFLCRKTGWGSSKGGLSSAYRATNRFGRISRRGSSGTAGIHQTWREWLGPADELDSSFNNATASQVNEDLPLGESFLTYKQYFRDRHLLFGLFLANNESVSPLYDSPARLTALIVNLFMNSAFSAIWYHRNPIYTEHRWVSVALLTAFCLSPANILLQLLFESQSHTWIIYAVASMLLGWCSFMIFLFTNTLTNEGILDWLGSSGLCFLVQMVLVQCSATYLTYMWRLYRMRSSKIADTSHQEISTRSHSRTKSKSSRRKTVEYDPIAILAMNEPIAVHNSVGPSSAVGKRGSHANAIELAASSNKIPTKTKAGTMKITKAELDKYSDIYGINGSNNNGAASSNQSMENGGISNYRKIVRSGGEMKELDPPAATSGSGAGSKQAHTRGASATVSVNRNFKFGTMKLSKAEYADAALAANARANQQRTPQPVQPQQNLIQEQFKIEEQPERSVTLPPAPGTPSTNKTTPKPGILSRIRLSISRGKHSAEPSVVPPPPENTNSMLRRYSASTSGLPPPPPSTNRASFIGNLMGLGRKNKKKLADNSANQDNNNNNAADPRASPKSSSVPAPPVQSYDGNSSDSSPALSPAASPSIQAKSVFAAMFLPPTKEAEQPEDEDEAISTASRSNASPEMSPELQHRRVEEKTKATEQDIEEENNENDEIEEKYQ